MKKYSDMSLYESQLKLSILRIISSNFLPIIDFQNGLIHCI